jgi:hypothetical protein
MHQPTIPDCVDYYIPVLVIGPSTSLATSQHKLVYDSHPDQEISEYQVNHVWTSITILQPEYGKDQLYTQPEV